MRDPTTAADAADAVESEAVRPLAEPLTEDVVR
jgi:hypothetical protein